MESTLYAGFSHSLVLYLRKKLKQLLTAFFNSSVCAQCLKTDITGRLTKRVDFEMAFDSIHREPWWNIMRSYVIPPKIINIDSH